MTLISMGFLQSTCVGQENHTSAMQAANDHYPKMVFPKDSTKLWFGEGDPESDTVLIFCDGGPGTMISYDTDGKTQWRYIPNFNNYYRAFVHQSQTYNREVFNFKEEFSVADAKIEVDNTSEILYRAIKYFKDRKKRVVVIGHSYGAFIMAHYLATRPSLADQYMFSGGRLDVQPIIEEYHLKGMNGRFDEDGITYIPPKADSEEKIRYSQERYWRIFRVKQLLKGVIGEYRYTKELANKDLSNVTYFYASNDQNVGRMTQEEVDFLKSKNVTVFETHDGHYEIWKRIIDAFREGKIKI